MVEVYDLLDQFCEFVIINLPYIRKHKDCPNDVNEAVSTLIFSSARFGELPELISIRKLFKERYGQQFVMVALELLPGNLVNYQIKESLPMKKVGDDDKYRLLDEIASSCAEPGPLLLEYKPEWQEKQAINGSNPILNSDVRVNDNNKVSELQFYNVNEAEGTIIHVGSPHVSNNKISRESSSFGLRKDETFSNAIQNSELVEVDDFRISTRKSLDIVVYESSSSETSAQLPKELIYLDDIEEFVSPAVSKDGNLQDQRLFMFKSFGTFPTSKPKTDYGIEKYKPSHIRPSVSRSSTKTAQQASRKRLRRRSSSQENRISKDTQCATYYGVSAENSPDNKHKTHRDKRERTIKSLGIVKKGSSSSSLSSTKSRENEEKYRIKNPWYLCGGDESYAMETPYRIQKAKISEDKDVAVNSINEEKKIIFSMRGEEADQQPYMRALTMPNERPNESSIENIFRSNSYSFEQPCIRGYSSNQHIHPKLPDYDELAAKFMALKKETLQKF